MGFAFVGLNRDDRRMSRARTAGSWTALFLCFLYFVGLPVFGQGDEEPRLFGGPVLGTGGAFDTSYAHGSGTTQDAFLSMGGLVGFRIYPGFYWQVEASFVANVSDNDAFNDRSLLASTGGAWSWKPTARLQPWVEGGFAFAEGSPASRRFAYGGFAVRRWYGEGIGWQLGVREHLSDDLHLVQLRLSVLLR